MDLRGVSRKEMCDTLHFKYSTLSEWLQAKKYPRIDKIEMMANYFGIEKSDLVEEPIIIDGKRLQFESFSTRLRKALKLRDMKQIDIAKATGISESAISQYLSGYARPKDDRVHALAIALDVSEGWLLGFDANMDRIDLSKLHAPTRIVLPDSDDVINIADLSEEQQKIIKDMIKVFKEGK